MQKRVTDMTERLALVARLLLVAVACLFISSPGELRIAGQPANAAATLTDERRFAVDLAIANIATADLVAASSPPVSDSEGTAHQIAPRTRITIITIDEPNPGYVLPHGELLATAFAPRGPPQA